MFDDDFDLGDAMVLGTGYALLRHGQDRQAQKLIDALKQRDAPAPIDPIPDPIPDPPAQQTNHLDNVSAEVLDDWDDYIGQEPLKNQLAVAIKSAQLRDDRLPHILLASGYPGVGKTTAARLLAKTMGVKMIELVPPFNTEALIEALAQLGDKEIAFIDEIHKMVDGVGARGAEVLLKVLEDGMAYLKDGTAIQLSDITIIGATTDRDKLPETVVDRFKLKPYFQAYDPIELSVITIAFAYRHRAENFVTDDLAIAISDACRGTPRIIEEMVLAARDLALVSGQPATPEQLLSFLETEPDGLTRTHVHYLTALRKYFARATKDETIEYIVGESAMQQILRETKQGIGRVERFLVERGLIDRTPRGRRLTDLGIARAEEFIAAGKGVADVA